MECQRQPRNQAKTVAVDCDRLPEMFHGKEGVDGSSPSEGFEKSLQFGGFIPPLLLALATKVAPGRTRHSKRGDPLLSEEGAKRAHW
jgi:hypothetical protein